MTSSLISTRCLLSQYNPPLATNTGNNFTTYACNLNRQLTNVTRPDGLQINFAYEALDGRLDHAKSGTSAASDMLRLQSCV